MNELDALRYWTGQGITGNALIKKCTDVLSNYSKSSNKQRKQEILALGVSLLKAKCHEDGIKWSRMALSEHTFIRAIEELPGIQRPERPPAPKEPAKPEKPLPTAKELEREHKKKELAEQVVSAEKEIARLKKELEE
jgi:hypothetical protein